MQFGKPISSFQAIQFKIADMDTELEAVGLMLLRAAIEDVQVFGGYGDIKKYPAERHMRDAKICQIYEGANEIQRVVVASKLLGMR